MSDLGDDKNDGASEDTPIKSWSRYLELKTGNDQIRIVSPNGIVRINAEIQKKEKGQVDSALASAIDPLHATIEEFAANGYTHVECFCPRCRVIRLRSMSWGTEPPPGEALFAQHLRLECEPRTWVDALRRPRAQQ
jgi:hypothetical protein